MFGITWPNNTHAIINKIRYTIGRVVTLYVTVSGDPCPICTLDPVTSLSTDPFCSGCAGDYWINTLSAWTCSAHVRWRNADRPLWMSGGLIEEGDCKITINLSGYALTAVKNLRYAVVDDVPMYLKDYKLRGVQPLNRITLTLLEDPDV